MAGEHRVAAFAAKTRMDIKAHDTNSTLAICGGNDARSALMAETTAQLDRNHTLTNQFSCDGLGRGIVGHSNDCQIDLRRADSAAMRLRIRPTGEEYESCLQRHRIKPSLPV
jgi:hypothetical protein